MTKKDKIYIEREVEAFILDSTKESTIPKKYLTAFICDLYDYAPMINYSVIHKSDKVTITKQYKKNN